MTRPINRDATSVILTVIVLDSDGAAIPDIAWNDPDLAIHWRASAGGSWTAITRGEGTVGTWSSGGWVHLGLGVYQLGLPNAAVVAGDRTTVRLVYDAHPPQYAAIDAVLYPSVDVSSDVAAIKAKTDNLPASPAAVGSAMTLTGGERTSIGTAVWASSTRTLTTAIPTANQTRDAVWAAATRTLTSNPGLDAAGIRSAIGMSLANHDAQIVGILDAIGDIPGGGGGLDAAGIRAAMGLATDNLDIQLAGIVSDIAGIGGGGGGGGLTKADVRDAIGLTDPDLGDQLADILEAISDIEVGGELPSEIADDILPDLITALKPYVVDANLPGVTTAGQFVITARDDYDNGPDVQPIGPIRIQTAMELLRPSNPPTLRFGATQQLGARLGDVKFVGTAYAVAVDNDESGQLYDIYIEIEKTELNRTPGIYSWDVEAVFPSGLVQTLFGGALTLRASMGDWEDRDPPPEP